MKAGFYLKISIEKKVFLKKKLRGRQKGKDKIQVKQIIYMTLQ